MTELVISKGIYSCMGGIGPNAAELIKRGELCIAFIDHITCQHTCRGSCVLILTMDGNAYRVCENHMREYSRSLSTG